MKLDTIDLLIFDVDGTVIDSTEAIVRSFTETLVEHGFAPADREQLCSMIGLPLYSMFGTIIGVDPESEIVQQCIDDYRNRYTTIAVDHTTLQPFAQEILSFYQGKKALSIATTKTSTQAKHILDYLGVGHYFDAVFGIDSVVLPKPDPEIIHKNLQHFSVAPERAVIIGDSTYDIDAGKGAGIHTIGITTGTHSREVLTQAGAGYIIDSLEELQDIIS